MIDNWSKIKELLHDPDDNILYMFEVIKRRKDNPDMKKGTHVLDTVITSDWDNEGLHNRLKKYVENDNARIYFKINYIEAEPVALRTLAKIATMIASGQYGIRNCYDSVCGEFKTGEVYWIIDIDTKSVDLDFLSKHLFVLQTEAKHTPVNCLLDTPNGYHMITRSFDPRKFTFPFDIQKNQPTVLYANEKVLEESSLKEIENDFSEL